jgi:ABC-2 type transport system ATP-binding protein
MLRLYKVSKSFKKRIKSGSLFRDWFKPKFENFDALKSISFEVTQWEKVAFIWPNGAGKSTTIKAILGILHYDAWEIQLFEKDPKKDRKIIAKFTSSVFGQRSQLLYHLPLMDSFNFLEYCTIFPKIFLIKDWKNL